MRKIRQYFISLMEINLIVDKRKAITLIISQNTIYGLINIIGYLNYFSKGVINLIIIYDEVRIYIIIFYSTVPYCVNTVLCAIIVVLLLNRINLQFKKIIAKV